MLEVGLERQTQMNPQSRVRYSTEYKRNISWVFLTANLPDHDKEFVKLMLWCGSDLDSIWFIGGDQWLSQDSTPVVFENVSTTSNLLG